MPWRTPRLVLVRTTVGREADARSLADRLLDAGAACVHTSKVSSRYDWKGKREAADEWLVEARTTIGGEDLVRRAMAEGHPYDLPLIESWRVEVNGAYAAWAATPK